MRHPNTRVSLIAASIAATLCAAPPLHAAEKALEEVIVTARKRDENLQQVPTAINVLTASALEDRQIANIVDLERTSPNVTLTETGGSQAGALQVFMRGIGNDNGFDPGIGIYIDDVFIQRPQGSMLDLYDVERIEVLKGPQGNLYGRNTIGGAIKYITREPNETPEASIEGKIGSYNLRQVKASVSGPLVDDVLYGGLGLMSKKRDGIQTNEATGKKTWDADVQGIRGNLKFTPNESLTFKMGLDYVYDNSNARMPKLIAADEATLTNTYLGAMYGVPAYSIPAGALPAGSPPPDFSQAHTGVDKMATDADPSLYKLRTYTGYFTAIWDIDDSWSLKSVTTERRTDQTFVGEFDGSAIPYLTNTQYVYADDLSQEFQANYSGDNLDLVVGAFYTDGRQQTPSVGTITPYAISLPTRTTDTTQTTIRLKSWSLYGNVDYTFAEDWHASLGLRQTSDKKTFESHSVVTYTSTPEVAPYIQYLQSIGQFPTGGNEDYGPESKTWSNFSPSAKLAYDFNEDTMGYLSVATGFKSGGFNSYPNGLPEGVSVTYNPEKVKTYALGLKTTLFNGRLRLNTEAFYNDYTDKQLQYLFTPPGGTLTTVYTNAGKVVTKGIETEISWLTPIDGLAVDLNVGYLDANIKKFNRLNDNNQMVDVSDHSAIGFSPRWTVQPRISYSMAVADLGDLMLAADASYRSKSFTNSPVDTSDELSLTQQQPEHVIYNANIVFNTADNHWRFALEGRNLTNRRVLTNTFDLDLGLNPAGHSTFVMGSYNDPKTWALSAAYKY